MTDFHTHILPGIDDGADSVETALSMLDSSREQGVKLLFATPHFYADEDDPETFLRERERAYGQLLEAMKDPARYPRIVLGAEILYYPGMSMTEELYSLRMGDTPYLLIEPPMCPWTETMLEEIRETGENLGLIPVIAHIDRYMRMLRDDTLLDRAERLGIPVQVNTSYFLRSSTARRAVRELRNGRIRFIGSDCHDTEARPANLAAVRRVLREYGAEAELERLHP